MSHSTDSLRGQGDFFQLGFVGKMDEFTAWIEERLPKAESSDIAPLSGAVIPPAIFGASLLHSRE